MNLVTRERVVTLQGCEYRLLNLSDGRGFLMIISEQGELISAGEIEAQRLEWVEEASRAEASDEAGYCESCGVPSFGFHCPMCEWEAKSETD